MRQSRWFAAQVKTNREFSVSTALTAKGYDTFVPVYTSVRRWSDRTKAIRLPLISGYVFLRAIPDQPQGMIVSTPGLIGLVRFGEQLVPIDDAEIDRVRTVADSALAVQPWPYLAHGSKVTIVRGALSGISGTIQRIGEKTVLVVSVEILQRSVAVHLDRSWIEPAKTFVHVESAIVGRSRGQAVVPTRSVSLNRLS